mgnify:CR=1 FL=1
MVSRRATQRGVTYIALLLAVAVAIAVLRRPSAKPAQPGTAVGAQTFYATSTESVLDALMSRQVQK